MDRRIETVLLSTHNICFGLDIRKSFFRDARLTKGMVVQVILHLTINKSNPYTSKFNSTYNQVEVNLEEYRFRSEHEFIYK